MKKSKEAILILPNIRSAINIGAIFRTADAVGISKVYLTGYSPRPTDKFGRVQKDIAKSALGAETWIPWEYQSTTLPLIRKLKKRGFKVVAIEQDKKAINYKKVKLNGKIAIVLGPEVEGLDQKILKECDQIAYIPMLGKKESLNVSVACGIALFQIFKI